MTAILMTAPVCQEDHPSARRTDVGSRRGPSRIPSSRRVFVVYTYQPTPRQDEYQAAGATRPLQSSDAQRGRLQENRFIRHFRREPASLRRAQGTEAAVTARVSSKTRKFKV